jgi:hypothetical protein
MSRYPIAPVEFGALRTVPLASRGGKVKLAPRALATLGFAHLLKPVAHGARRLAEGVRGPRPEALGGFWGDSGGLAPRRGGVSNFPASSPGAVCHSKRNSLRSLGLQTQAP